MGIPADQFRRERGLVQQFWREHQPPPYMSHLPRASNGDWAPAFSCKYTNIRASDIHEALTGWNESARYWQGRVNAERAAHNMVGCFEMGDWQ